jgi:hypothetical protein
MRLRRVHLIAVTAFCLGGFCRAFAADLPSEPPVVKAPDVVASPSILSPYYVGGAFSWTHHTGYLPVNSLAGPSWNGLEVWNVGQYTPGGKVFAGYRFTSNWQVEGAFHYLGTASFMSGLPNAGTIIPLTNQERSWAVAGSVIYAFPPLSDLVGPTPIPMHLLLRFGLAYKDITQDTSLVGRFHEGTLAGVVGAALEFRMTPHWFTRIEYEFISTALTGPSESVPALRGLFRVNLGGTHNVVNVMNTPLSLTLGYNF